MREMRVKILDYMKYNHQKLLTIQVYLYSAYYRLRIKFQPQDKMQDLIFGVRGEESPAEETRENLKTARIIGYHVDRVTEHTPWESKCLVRALTAGRILKKRHIASTLYLGVGKDNEKMVAHAWLRCGQLYVTGGNGAPYAMVAKFCL